MDRLGYDCLEAIEMTKWLCLKTVSTTKLLIIAVPDVEDRVHEAKLGVFDHVCDEGDNVYFLKYTCKQMEDIMIAKTAPLFEVSKIVPQLIFV